MTQAEVIDKIHHLPPAVQQHLFKYVDFLYETYSSPDTSGEETSAAQFFAEHELNEAGKFFLENRAVRAIEGQATSVSWQEARKKIHEKHNLPL